MLRLEVKNSRKRREMVGMGRGHSVSQPGGIAPHSSWISDIVLIRYIQFIAVAVLQL